MFTYNVKGNHNKLEKADTHLKKQNPEKILSLIYYLKHFYSTFSYKFVCKL